MVKVLDYILNLIKVIGTSISLLLVIIMLVAILILSALFGIRRNVKDRLKMVERMIDSLQKKRDQLKEQMAQEE